VIGALSEVEVAAAGASEVEALSGSFSQSNSSGGGAYRVKRVHSASAYVPWHRMVYSSSQVFS
jgi:hypothetical protein